MCTSTYWVEVTGQLERQYVTFEETVPRESEHCVEQKDRSHSTAVHEPRPAACD
jgi:hypothetical protein